ncbi:hypothetical protein MIND_00184400 [Mycena indigotica]|uniref:Uncharacterized protein n=1 Tax=Mycena indigotica TaxID=2126181 RepID=A0A8H6T876_9AGAR|nr:uncharacterized protein MIND_00184400 [Mycena indigotica]KAF7311742.1 hypothetical protein MIND_00184400 [Mycena indigotica]
MRHLLDFMSYAHFQVQTDDSLTAMQMSWEKMHKDLPVFQELGPERNDFNIPKLHNIRHYVDSIRLLGSADGYNTENTERLHIDLAKNGYRASNRRDYIQQMTRLAHPPRSSPPFLAISPVGLPRICTRAGLQAPF